MQINRHPLGLSFQAGQQLRFVISGQNLLGTLMPGIREHEPANAGQHVVRTDGDRASYPQLPV